MSHYDVVVIGSGAGGGTLVHRLAPSGKRILLLERGDWLPREPANWDPQAVTVDDRYVSRDVWYDERGRAFQPQVHYFVGGATKVFGAALHRLRAKDFDAVAHPGGTSPAWPIGYDDLEPYYTQAEGLYDVHGQRGEDPTEPPAGAPFPRPAVSHEPRIQKLADDLLARGHHPFHAPSAVRLDERDPTASACVRCATCDGFPCLVHAKSDAELAAVRPAVAHANVELLTDAHAVRLETDPSGRTVTGVVVQRDGGLERHSGDLVVVACGAANSARLLLASSSDAYPGGLANGSDQVGRNYMIHQGQAVLGLSREPNPTRFQKTLALNDFYFAGPAAEYPLGSIQLAGRSSPAMYRGERMPQTRLAPEWSLRDIADHAIDFWLCTEDLPRPENRITLRGDGALKVAYKPTNELPRRRLVQQLKGLLRHLDMHEHLVPRRAYRKDELTVAACGHQAGTCRFGSDPADSVLDADCRAHELDNLYVVDASFLPSSGALDPGLTVMANALRVADHLLGRLGATVAAQDSAPRRPLAQR